MKRYALLILWFGSCGFGQTGVDLRTQARDVDFTGATYTKPVRTGQTLPATCSIGEIFFLLSQTASQSGLYTCPAANSWAASGGSGSLSWQNGGVSLGTASAVDFAAGDGVVTSVTNSGGAITVETSADTSVLLTNGAYQSAAPILCASKGHSSSAYSCGLVPQLQNYGTPTLLLWVPDVANAAGPTLNIDTLGSVSVTASDGTALPANAVIAGGLYPIWYDGQEFRLVVGLGTATPGVTGSSSSSYTTTQSSMVVGCGASSPYPQWWIAVDGNMGPGCYANNGNVVGWEGVGPVSSLSPNDVMIWNVIVPHAWVNGSVTVTALYGDAGTAGTYQFGISASCGTANAVQNLPAVTGSGNYSIQQVLLTGLNMSGCAADSMLNLKFTRVDASSGTARFYGASISYSIP